MMYTITLWQSELGSLWYVVGEEGPVASFRTKQEAEDAAERLNWEATLTPYLGGE